MGKINNNTFLYYVIEYNDTWTNIKLENGNEGWIKTADIGLF